MEETSVYNVECATSVEKMVKKAGVAILLIGLGKDRKRFPATNLPYTVNVMRFCKALLRLLAKERRSVFASQISRHFPKPR